MKPGNFKILVSAILLFIFVIKMGISLAPVFTLLDSKTVNAVIMQLEDETKTEKENPDKGVFKEKKIVEENLFTFFEYRPILVETNILHNLEHALYKQSYHPVVPTPPPNV